MNSLELIPASAGGSNLGATSFPHAMDAGRDPMSDSRKKKVGSLVMMRQPHSNPYIPQPGTQHEAGTDPATQVSRFGPALTLANLSGLELDCR